MNSAFPRISHPVSSETRRSRINGVFPTYPSTPAYFAVIVKTLTVIVLVVFLDLVLCQHPTLNAQARKARAGSMRTTRHAGNRHEISATLIIRRTAPPNATGSCGLTW